MLQIYWNLLLLSGAQGAWPWAMVQQQTTRETEMEQFITHRSWRKYTACLQGYTAGGESKVQAERATEPGVQALIRVRAWVECESWVGQFKPED